MSASIARRATFFAKIMASAVVAPVAFGVVGIVESGAKVLLVRHSYMSGWHLPGGGARRGEPPQDAIIRELREEIGLKNSAPPELFGLYTRKAGLATNVIAAYLVKDAQYVFTPNLEIRETILVDPAAPSPGTARGAARRLAELSARAARSPYW